MKKLNKKLKLFGTVATILGASAISMTTASAWGPERSTFTMDNPATYPTFNSITDNPTIGDERDFVRIGEINADVTDLANNIEIVPGRQYLVYVYFHNDASSTFNDSAHNHSGVALQTRMSSSFSTVLTPSESGRVTATITANNTSPESVWDEATMSTTTDKVLMRYVTGSARIYNDWGTNGSVISSNLFTETGTLLGLNTLNGVIPGCEEYHGVVSYVLQAEELGGTVEKTVSKDGTNYSESVEAIPGDTINYQLAIYNTGDVELTNATIKDSLPEGIDLVPGSVGLRANESATVDPLSDNLITDGYNLGTIGTGNVIYITYQATVSGEYDCTGDELVNNATLTYDSNTTTGDSDSDTATVIAKKPDCIEEVPPLDDCTTNPGQTECQSTPSELPNTGPVEIILAIIIILGIGGGGFYFYRSRKKLASVTSNVSGGETNQNMNSPIAPQTPDNPVQPSTPSQPVAPSNNSTPVNKTKPLHKTS